MCQVLANWHSFSNTINGHRVSVVDVVGPFPAFLSQKVVGGIPLDLDWLHNLVRGVSFSHLFEAQLYGVLVYFRIRLESGQNAKLLENFLGLNAVRISYVCVKLDMKSGVR